MYRTRGTKNRKLCIYTHESERLKDTDIIIFDTETTGLDPDKDRIVELAARKYRNNGKGLDLIETRDWYLRPPFLMDEKVVSIHGISNESLLESPSEKDAIDEISDWFGTESILAGYNVAFDIRMLQAMFQRCQKQLHGKGILDVLEMARDVVYDKELDNYQLSTVIDYLGLDTNLKFHSASDDVVATYRLMEYCYQTYKEIDEDKNKYKPYLNRLYYWKGYKKEQSGIYVVTSVNSQKEGTIYYSTYQKAWCSSKIDLTKLDIDHLEAQVLKRMRMKDMIEVGRMTEKRFRDLKENLKKEGVYL